MLGMGTDEHYEWVKKKLKREKRERERKRGGGVAVRWFYIIWSVRVFFCLLSCFDYFIPPCPLALRQTKILIDANRKYKPNIKTLCNSISAPTCTQPKQFAMMCHQWSTFPMKWNRTQNPLFAQRQECAEIQPTQTITHIKRYHCSITEIINQMTGFCDGYFTVITDRYQILMYE